MELETKFMESLLPCHYTCEPRENGVHCYSSVGIPSETEWDIIFQIIKDKFGDRFMEVFHQTCTNNVKFTVYIKPLL